MQGVNDWASLWVCTATATFHQIVQSRFHLSQAGDPAAHIIQFVLSQRASLIAMGAVLQFQEFGHLIQVKPQPLGGADKVQPDQLSAMGTVLVALCCFTPIPVVLLGVVGLSAMTGYLDFVLLPVLGLFLGLTIYALWRKKKHDACCDSPSPKE